MLTFWVGSLSKRFLRIERRTASREPQVTEETIMFIEFVVLSYLIFKINLGVIITFDISLN